MIEGSNCLISSNLVRLHITPGTRQPLTGQHAPGFLKSFSCGYVRMHVCVHPQDHK